MGGRGGYSGASPLNGIKKRAETWFREATKFERAMDEKEGREGNNTRVQGLKRSPTWMSALRDSIEKDAFDRDYEITIKQVDKIVSDLFEKAKRKRR